MGSTWVSVIIYCAFIFLFLYFWPIKEMGFAGGLIISFFAVIGVIYVLIAAHHTINSFKYGQVYLNLPIDKPVLGGELAGSVVLPGQAAQARNVRVELRCLKEVIVTNRKGRAKRMQDREWYEERFFVVHRSGRGAEAQFRMKIPDEPNVLRNETYVWEVQVVAELPGVDLSRSFVIDVAKPQSATPTRPSRPTMAAQVTTPTEKEFVPAQMFIAPRIARSPTQPQTGPSSKAAAAATGSQVVRNVAQPDTASMTLAVAAAQPTALDAEPESLMPVAALIAANLVPLAGVLVLDWQVEDVVLLYWLENLVIGVMNLARIAFAQPDDLMRNPQRGKRLKPHELLIGKLVLGGFFFMHYGAFCFAHGSFLSFMFPIQGPDGRNLKITGIIEHMLTDPGILVAVLALLTSHLISFSRNFLGRDEYRRVDFTSLMTQPYGRIVVVHIFIIAGGFLVMGLEGPVVAMALFVIIKTAVDLHMHRRERTMLFR